MFADRKRFRWCRNHLFSMAMLSVTICYIGAFTACGGGKLPPDRPLTHNGVISDDKAPVAISTASRKTIKPIEIVSDQSSLTSYANGKMNLTITTSPYAICNFIINYGMSVPSRAFGIRPVTADAQGIANWQWQVEGKAPTGIWPLKITATSVNGAHTTQTTNVTITLPPIHLDSAKSILNVARKARATLAVVTAPLVACTLTMSYASRMKKTLTGTTDGRGEIIWTWNVEAGANEGSAPLTVTITTGSGEQASATFLITIR